MALDDPNQRPDQRDEDREDETDRAIRQARQYSQAAVELLANTIMSKDYLQEDRIKAAIALLEVAGCL